MKANPKMLINDDPCIDSNGEMQWFPEPYFESDSIKGTFRHRNCVRVAYKGQMLNSICRFCRSIPNSKTFRERLRRRFQRGDSIENEKSIPYKYRNKAQLLTAMQESSEKLDSYRKKCFLLECDIERLKRSTDRLKEDMKVITEKGTFGEVAIKVNKSIRKGVLQNKEGVINIITTIAKNMPRLSKGHRYQSKDNSDYTDLFESALIIVGPRICNLLADNLGGPHIDTVRSWTKKTHFSTTFLALKRI